MSDEKTKQLKIEISFSKNNKKKATRRRHHHDTFFPFHQIKESDNKINFFVDVLFFNFMPRARSSVLKGTF